MNKHDVCIQQLVALKCLLLVITHNLKISKLMDIQNQIQSWVVPIIDCGLQLSVSNFQVQTEQPPVKCYKKVNKYKKPELGHCAPKSASTQFFWACKYFI